MRTVRGAWGSRLDRAPEVMDTLSAETEEEATEFHDESDDLVLGERLGVGGHAVVHAATQPRVGRIVAVKSPRTDVAEPTARWVLHEARVTAALEHPNVVPVYDVQLRGGGPRILLRKVEGHTWADVMDAPPSADPLAWNLRILASVCNAVAFAHDRGILHRDVKPRNVMVGRFGEVYLMDWGLAVSLSARDRGRLPLAVDQREPVGTPAYMAPEMVLGEGAALGPWTDVYLLGATLYHVLAGRPPRRGSAVMALEEALTGARPPPPPGPAEVRALCERAMDPDPPARPTAADFGAALEAFLARRGTDGLVARARGDLVELQSAIAADDRPAALRAFGASRAAFDAALDARPDLEEAIRGRRDAALALAEYELAGRRPDAARLAVAGLTDVPPELAQRIEARERAHDRERAEAARLRASLDRRPGGALRVGLLATALVLAMSWVSAVAVAMPLSYVRALIATSGVALICGTAAVVGVLRLPATRHNRVLWACLGGVPALVLASTVGNLVGGASASDNARDSLLVYGVSIAVVALIHDIRLGPSALCFLLGFVAIAWAPPAFLLISGACQVVLVLNVAVVWLAETARESTRASERATPGDRPGADPPEEVR